VSAQYGPTGERENDMKITLLVMIAVVADVALVSVSLNLF